MCVCVCVCVLCVCACCVRACVRACVRTCVRACVRDVSACVRVLLEHPPNMSMRVSEKLVQKLSRWLYPFKNKYVGDRS